jgi:hypothetical protein
MPAPVIYLHSEAPAKPAAGAACNGCGLCCAWQPCPLGVLVSGSRTGACKALRWDDPARIYRCNMVSAPQAVWPWLPSWSQRLLSRLARRWIASGMGCDCNAEIDRF